MICPELIVKQAGDESYGWCKLEDIMCHRENGYECGEYDLLLKEENEEIKKQQGLLGVG